MRHHVSIPATTRAALLAGLELLLVLASGAASAAVYNTPTTSSPIAMTNDKQFVWVVSSGDDRVYVMDAASPYTVRSTITVGHEPQAVAIDPNSGYAYVANAADNSVSVIQVTAGGAGGIVQTTFLTGAEPWNIVISPDGKRVYVANSGQDTITVIKSDVSFPTLPSIIGNVQLNNSACNTDNPDRHFQPRGLAVTLDNTRLYVSRFLSMVKPGGTQATDGGKEGLVCRLTINTAAVTKGTSVTGFTPIKLAATDTGFIDKNLSSTSAYPNQMQSIVLRGNSAYLANVAASTGGPLNFDNDTHAYVSKISNTTAAETDGGAVNLHLGARVPESGRTRLFFANAWGMAFTSQSGAGTAYVVAAGSDLLVKLNVDAGGTLAFTGNASTTRYVDLNDPNSASTQGAKAGKNPRGIVIGAPGNVGNLLAYVVNHVSRNVSVVDLSTDAVIATIQLQALPASGSSGEQRLVGAEMFFSSRGHFERPAGTVVATDNRLSSEGWQACSSCHFSGLTDGNVWVFDSGPRKSIPLNATFNPHNPDDQRMLNYSATQDEVEDLELNIRNVSGPGPLAGAFDPNFGLLINDTTGINFAPAAIDGLATPNANRPQHTVKLPGSATSWPALTALREWVRFGVRTPGRVLTTTELAASNPDTTGGVDPVAVSQGRQLFLQQGCQNCHGGAKWTTSRKNFVSPPIDTDTENPPIATAAPLPYIPRYLSNINSFNLNVAGAGNLLAGTPSIAAIEKAADGKDALGTDYDGDGHGSGYNIPSLLGIWHLPPYYHNGACETLACVLGHQAHRTANGTLPDLLVNAADQAKVVAFLKSLDAQTPTTPLNLVFADSFE